GVENRGDRSSSSRRRQRSKEGNSRVPKQWEAPDAPALAIWRSITTHRARTTVAVGRNNWVFFGRDQGRRSAPVLRSFVAFCHASESILSIWFKDVLPRIAVHPITRRAELLPHNWSPAQT